MTGPVPVRVWAVPLDVPDARVVGCVQRIPPAERARLDRYPTPALRRRQAVAWGETFRLLAAALDVAPQRIRLDRGRWGKPRIAWPATSLRFNLSHTHDLALVACCDGSEVGVDVEGIRAVPDWERVADRHFSPAERRALRRSPSDSRLVAWWRTWTRKEALLKASGRGLVPDLAAVDTAGRVGSYALSDLALGVAHVGTVAVELRPDPRRLAGEEAGGLL